jgi:hypothetical protein
MQRAASWLASADSTHTAFSRSVLPLLSFPPKKPQSHSCSTIIAVGGAKCGRLESSPPRAGFGGHFSSCYCCACADKSDAYISAVLAELAGVRDGPEEDALHERACLAMAGE